MGPGLAVAACEQVPTRVTVRPKPPSVVSTSRGVSDPLPIEDLLEQLPSRQAQRCVEIAEQAYPHLWGPEREDWYCLLDARGGQVATHGWRQTSQTTAVALGTAMRQQGVIRVVYTDIARDGMLSGVNVEATAALARETGLRVIASGGVASVQDVRQLKARAADGIEGAIVGQALYSGVISLVEALQA